MRQARSLLCALLLSLLVHTGAALGLRGLGFGPRPLPPLVVELVAPVVATPWPERLTEEAAPPEATATPPPPPAGGREAARRPAPTEPPAEAPPASKPRRGAPPPFRTLPPGVAAAKPPLGADQSIRELRVEHAERPGRAAHTHGAPSPRPLVPEERLVLSRAPSTPAPAPAEPAAPPQPSLASLDRLVASAPIPEPSQSPPTASTETAAPSSGPGAQVSPSVPSPPPFSQLTAMARGNRVRDGRGGEAGAGEAPARPGGARAMDRPGGPNHEVIGDGAGSQGTATREGGEESTRLAALPGGSREAGGAPSEYRAYLEAFRRKIQGSLVYPSAALRRQLQGTVRLEVRLRETGEVAGVGLLHSSGHAILDEAAVGTVEAAGPFPFPPGLRPRPLTIQLPIVFELR